MSWMVSFFMSLHVDSLDNKVKSDRVIRSNQVFQFDVDIKS